MTGFDIAKSDRFPQGQRSDGSKNASKQLATARFGNNRIYVRCSSSYHLTNRESPPLTDCVDSFSNEKHEIMEGKRMASGFIGNEVPRKGLRVRVPCPPLLKSLKLLLDNDLRLFSYCNLV